MGGTRTGKTPSFCKTPSAVSAPKYRSHIVREDNGVFPDGEQESRKTVNSVWGPGQGNFATRMKAKLSTHSHWGREDRVRPLFVDELPG